MFIAAPVYNPPNKKEKTRFPSTDENTNKLVYIMEPSVGRRNELLIHAVTQMNLEGIMRSERSQP